MNALTCLCTATTTTKTERERERKNYINESFQLLI